MSRQKKNEYYELLEQGLKLCPDCGEIKPLAEFYKVKSGNYLTYCKDCSNRRSRESAKKKRLAKKQGSYSPRSYKKRNQEPETSVIIPVEPQKDALTIATEQVATIQGTINALQDTLLSVLAEMDEQKREYETKLAEVERQHQQEIDEMQAEFDERVRQVEREYRGRIEKERLLLKPDFNKLTDNDIIRVLASPKIVPRHLIQALYAIDSNYIVIRHDPSTGETMTMPKDCSAA